MFALFHVGIGFALLSVIALQFVDFGHLPYPFDSIPISPLREEFIDIFTWERHYSSEAIVHFAAAKSIPLTLLSDQNVQRLFVGEIIGAESIDVVHTAESYNLIMLDKYGYVRTAIQTDRAKRFELIPGSLYIGPGRPLGFHYYGNDTIFVCDSLKGLLSVDISGNFSSKTGNRIHILSNSYFDDTTDSAKGINYLNDLDISGDLATVYFSSSTGEGVVTYDSTQRYYDTMRSFLLTWLAGDVSGRVFSYDIESGKTSTVTDDLFYANGVAVSSDDSFLLVVETMGLRVWKVYLNGARKGQREIFIEHLPAFPDGVTRSQDGKSFFVSLVAPLSPILPLGQSPFSRWVIAWALMGPFKGLFGQLIKRCGSVIRISADTAEVEAVYFDSTGEYVSTISAVTEDKSGRLFFGNLGGDYISHFSP